MKNIYEERSRLLSSGETIYIKDDFYDAAIRLVPTGKGIEAFIKHIGKKEKKIDYKEEIIYQIECGGEFISKDEYQLY